MTVGVAVGLCVVFTLMALLNALALWAVHSKRYCGYRIRTPLLERPSAKPKYANIVLNSAVSLSFCCFCLNFGSAWLIEDKSLRVPWLATEVAASLLLCNFLYYLMHRAIHRPRLMRLIHGVHRRIRYPTSLDCLYLNPLENADWNINVSSIGATKTLSTNIPRNDVDSRNSLPNPSSSSNPSSNEVNSKPTKATSKTPIRIHIARMSLSVGY